MAKYITQKEANRMFKKRYPNYTIKPYLFFRKLSVLKTKKRKKIRDTEIKRLKNKKVSNKVLCKKFNLTRARIWEICKK